MPFKLIIYIFLAGSMLKVDPRERPVIGDVIARLQEIAAARNVNPKAPFFAPKESPVHTAQQSK